MVSGRRRRGVLDASIKQPTPFHGSGGGWDVTAMSS